MASNIIPSDPVKLADQLVKDPAIQKASVPDLQEKPVASRASVASNSSAPSYVTLEPHNPSVGFRGRGSYRGKQNQRKPHQTIRERISMNEIFAPDFKKYYIMKANNEVNLWKTVNTITANKELEKYIKGTPKRVTELKNGTLLIEVNNKEQATKIQQIKYLNNVSVSVIEHSTLNFTKGTIRCKRFAEVSDDVLLEELRNASVTELYKIKRKEGNELKPTGTIILTFDKCNLPSHVKIGWKSFEVREYIPAPRRCFKCQTFNHSSKSCHTPDAICVNCGELEHGRECYAPPHCSNCEGPHQASDRTCFYYKMEKEILTVKTRDKVSYSEAKRIVLKRINNETTTYAGIVRESRKTPNTLNLNKKSPPVMPGNNTESSTNHIKQSTAQSPLLAQQPTTSSNAATTTNQFITGTSVRSQPTSSHTINNNKDRGNEPIKQTCKETTMTANSTPCSLRNITTIITPLNDRKEDNNNNKKRSIVEQNDNKANQPKIAKVRADGSQLKGSGEEIPPPQREPRGRQQQTRQQLSNITGGAVAPSSGLPGLQQGVEMEMEYAISPSPIITTRKPETRNRSSSRDNREHARDKR